MKQTKKEVGVILGDIHTYVLLNKDTLQVVLCSTEYMGRNIANARGWENYSIEKHSLMGTASEFKTERIK